jgi:hypothetical protein
MADISENELAPLFASMGASLLQNQQALNQADTLNGNHGDHMVEIFHIAAQAALERRDAEAPAALDYVAQLLQQQAHNGSAQVYAAGMRQMAVQFRRYNITTADLFDYVQGAIKEEKNQWPEQAPGANSPRPRSGDVLKALMSGLATWSQVENGFQPDEKPLDVGVLFEFGMAYMQARQRNQDRIEILADAAASISPLSKSPHRYQSGKIAIQALLRALQAE